MKVTLKPKTGLGKVSMWGIIYFFATWTFVALVQPYLGNPDGNRTFFDWILFLLAVSGMIGAFISMMGGLITLVWREDRSFLGFLLFLLSIPICVLLAGFLLGNYMI